jgi:hypothetical protein
MHQLEINLHRLDFLSSLPKTPRVESEIENTYLSFRHAFQNEFCLLEDYNYYRHKAFWELRKLTLIKGELS